MKTLEIVRAARERGDPHRLSELSPYARMIGITAENIAGELLGKLVYSDQIVGNATIPALHGGAIGALLESTAIFQLLWESDTASLPRIVTITVDYLRTGRAVDTYAKGTITKHGRRVANVRVDAWQENRERPIASAHAHFLLSP
jgi:acyl-coenzyme A thioesterase PaaI-like protein